MNNKLLGNKFENDLAEKLFKKGFWVHLLTQNKNGQPADIMAVKDGQAFLIDCKECGKDYFPLERIEENQHLAMRFWEDCGNQNAWFALRMQNQIYMITYYCLANLQKLGRSKIKRSRIEEWGFTLDDWLESFPYSCSRGEQ